MPFFCASSTTLRLLHFSQSTRASLATFHFISRFRVFGEDVCFEFSSRSNIYNVSFRFTLITPKIVLLKPSISHLWLRRNFSTNFRNSFLPHCLPLPRGGSLRLLLLIQVLSVNQTNPVNVLVSLVQSHYLFHLHSLIIFFFYIFLALATLSLSNSHVALTIPTKWMQI